MSVFVDFQNRINELVSELDIKRSDLPTIIGIDYSSFSNALNYGIIPKPKILIKIADYLDVSIPYLLARTDDDFFEKSESNINFYTRFQELVDENKITRYKVSKDCHFSNNYISRWFNKKYLPSFELLDIIADYFKVSIDYLLGRTDIKN